MICIKCNIDKNENQFAFRNKNLGLRNKRCKSCHNSYNRIHHIQNKEHIRTLKNKRWNDIKLKYRSWLLRQINGKKCVDCGFDNPIVLQFDHQRDKLFNVANALSNTKSIRKGISYKRLIKEVLLEIKKCEIICANCHAIRTAKTQKWYKLLSYI